MAVAPSSPLVPLSIGKYAVVRFLGPDPGADITGTRHTPASGVRAQPRSATPEGDVERYIARLDAAGAQAPRLILERVVRANVSPADFDAFTRRARRLAMVRHPNVPRVRDVFTTSEHAVVVTEFIEGKRWSSLDALAASEGRKPLSLEAQLKLILDTVAALAALHALREPGWSATDAGARVPSMIQGDVAPSNILVGTDGAGRLLGIHRMPLRAHTRPLDARSARSAPEILLGDGTADGRADVYSIGVILWETLAGRRLFTQPTVAEMLSRQLSGDLPAAPVPPSAPWAAPLAQIAATALAVDPKSRYANVVDLGVAIREAAARHLPGAPEIAREVRAIQSPTPPPAPARTWTALGIGMDAVPMLDPEDLLDEHEAPTRVTALQGMHRIPHPSSPSSYTQELPPPPDRSHPPPLPIAPVAPPSPAAPEPPSPSEFPPDLDAIDGRWSRMSLASVTETPLGPPQPEVRGFAAADLQPEVRGFAAADLQPEVRGFAAADLQPVPDLQPEPPAVQAPAARAPAVPVPTAPNQFVPPSLVGLGSASEGALGAAPAQERFADRISVPPRPSDITELTHRVKRKRVVFLLALAALLFTCIVSGTVLLSGTSRTKRSPEQARTAPTQSATSASVAMALAHATAVTSSSSSASSASAPAPPAPVAAAPATPAVRPQQPASAPAAPSHVVAAMPASRSPATGAVRSAPPAPSHPPPPAAPAARAPRSHTKHSVYVPLGI
ncbi:MAG TPA: protein kinase [Polyangiaceae bacterium]|nr:protein kinase [Polyangiaceae bacterium]